MVVIGITGWPSIARLMRGEVLKQRAIDYTLAAQALGSSHLRIVFRHILPNSLSPALVAVPFGIAGAIITEASLSLLGFGVEPATPSWGIAAATSACDNYHYWWLIVFPRWQFFSPSRCSISSATDCATRWIRDCGFNCCRTPCRRLHRDCLSNASTPSDHSRHVRPLVDVENLQDLLRHRRRRGQGGRRRFADAFRAARRWGWSARAGCGQDRHRHVDHPADLASRPNRRRPDHAARHDGAAAACSRNCPEPRDAPGPRRPDLDDLSGADDFAQSGVHRSARRSSKRSGCISRSARPRPAIGRSKCSAR